MSKHIRTLLHVFSTFEIGGPQRRFIQLANHYGRAYRHQIVAMDATAAAFDGLLPSIDAKLLAVPGVKAEHVRSSERSFGRRLAMRAGQARA